MKENVFKSLIFSFVLAAAVYLVLALYADFDQLAVSLRAVSFITVITVLLMSLLNFFVKFLRWNYYLGSVGANLPLSLNVYVFFSGLLMSPTPGKAGEILKSLLLKETKGTPVSLTTAIIFAERLTDLIAAVLLAFGFSFLLPVNYLIILAAFLMVLGFIALIAFDRPFRLLAGILQRFRLTGGFVSSLHRLFEESRRLLGIKHLTVGTVFGAAAWLLECAGFYLLLKGLGVEIAPGYSVLIYTLSALAGAVSMLPGGILFTEGTMSGMLIGLGVNKAQAVAATVLIRAFTLWFGSLLGLAVFFGLRRRAGK